VQTDKAGPTESARSGGALERSTADLIALGVARGAVVVGVLSALSRILGLTRTVVFSQTVGSGCLGTAYVTASQVPNLIYELAIGGALASAMVPVLARAAARAHAEEDQKEYVAQVTSALLTWSVVILLPVTVGIAVAAHPIASLLMPPNPNAACSRPAMLGTATDMIIAFAPQIVFYGISVVLTGLLQAYRRFTGPTLGPVLANAVIIVAFLVFASLDKNTPMTRTPLIAQLVLSIGTTINIAMLVIVMVPPTWRLHLRLRPTLRLPPGVLRLAGGLALVGLLEFLASDLCTVVTIALANGHGTTGAVVLVNYSTMVFSSICSVLPIAIVTSMFPVIAAADDATFNQTSAGSTRAVMLMSWLGTAVIAAVAVPAAYVLVSQHDQVSQLAETFLLCAPGVAGFGVIACMSRVMFAIGRLTAAGIGLVAGPLLQAALSFPLVALVPPRLVVPALTVASSVALLVVAVPMVLAIRRFRGPAAVAGVGRATFAGIVAGAAGAAVGVGVALVVPADGKLFEAASAVVATVLAVLVFGAVAYALDRDDLNIVVARLRRVGVSRG
jgi:putative peptidoglycan lipid II flippase